MSHNSHALQSIHFDLAIQWLLSYSHGCSAISTINLEQFHYPKMKPHSPQLVTLPNHPPSAPPPHYPALGNHQSTFCLYGFACSSLFMESFLFSLDITCPPQVLPHNVSVSADIILPISPRLRKQKLQHTTRSLLVFLSLESPQMDLNYTM